MKEHNDTLKCSSTSSLEYGVQYYGFCGFEYIIDSVKLRENA